MRSNRGVLGVLSSNQINIATFVHQMGRDVYRIKSIVSYRYHKTDTGIRSKWQINDSFNVTFYDDINKDRASLTQKWMTFFFLLNACFVFHFYIIWKFMVPEYYYTVWWVYQKAKRKKVNFSMVWYRIVSYRYHFVSIGILSYHKKIKGTHPYRWEMCVSPSMLAPCYWLKFLVTNRYNWYQLVS